MSQQTLRIMVILLVAVGLGIAGYLLWGVHRTGNLALVSTPPGARVLLNLDATSYLTDTLITNLPEGKYSVTLEMKGYVPDPFVQVVQVQRNQLCAVAFDMKPAPLDAEMQAPQKPQETQKIRPAYQPTYPIPTPRTTSLEPGRTRELGASREWETRNTPREIPQSSSLATAESTSSGTAGEYRPLEIASNIFGADIYMDGNPTGQQTNATLLVPVGSHRISVRKDNYKVEPEEIAVDVKSSGNGQFILFDLTQDMASLPYRLKVSTEPVSGGIMIDDIYRGQGVVNMEVDPGEYTVAFEPVEGYQTPSSRKATLTTEERTAVIVGTYERSLERHHRHGVGSGGQIGETHECLLLGTELGHRHPEPDRSGLHQIPIHRASGFLQNQSFGDEALYFQELQELSVDACQPR
jgi:hypothetical protein